MKKIIYVDMVGVLCASGEKTNPVILTSNPHS